MQTIHAFKQRKENQQKITMVTCYDYTSACLLDKTNIDCVLVGDTAAMLMLGNPDTTYATLDHISLFTQAVARGINEKLIIADLPFMTYRKSLRDSVDAVTQLMRAGAQGVKLEGATGNLETIHHIVESGVPVMGHLGLTPQHIHNLGGFKVQGKDHDTHALLLEQAQALESAGCFAVVLECIPSTLATEITQSLTIPTIGIGAGVNTDGQVLVWQDMLGLQTEFTPKFLKRYLEGASLFTDSINQYVEEVQKQIFPTEQHSYKADSECNR